MIFKRECPECKTKFTTDNKQKFYCSNKCTASRGWKKRKEKIAEEKKDKDQFFSHDDYKNSLF